MTTMSQDTIIGQILSGDDMKPTKAKARDLRTCSVMPIYMKMDGEEAGRITTSPKGSVLLHKGNLRMLPSGEYLIFVYSRFEGAHAAAQQHEFYGMSHYIEAGRTISGDGVLIVKSHMPAMRNQIVSVIGPHLSLRHSGENGGVSIDIIDFRDAPSHQNIHNPVLISSLTLSADMVHAHLDVRNGRDLPHHEIERGEKIARSIVREGLQIGTLRILQDRLEDIPGARITISGVSACMVLDHVEDIAEQITEEGVDAFDLPPLRHIHRDLYAMTKFGHAKGSDVARKLAETLISKGRLSKS